MFKYLDTQLKEKFYSLNSRHDVADLLNISEKRLRYILYGKRPENLYYTFNINKKNGTHRSICAPTKELKQLQKKLSYVLYLIYTPKLCTHGFIKDKNIFTNASGHIKGKNLLNIDLKDFFDQINFGRVRGVFIAKPYSLGIEAATVIAQIACFNGILPQGAPSSPIITNIICSPLDNALLKISKRYNLTYTRYVDDISLSTYQSSFPQNIVSKNTISESCVEILLGSVIIDTLSKHGFTINTDKIFLNPTSTRQEVTGLVVNEFVNLKRDYLKNIRSLLYQCNKNGLYSAALTYIELGLCKNKKIIDLSSEPKNQEIVEKWFLNVLKGKILFIKNIRTESNGYFLKYAKQLNTIANERIIKYNFDFDLGSAIEESVLVLTRQDGARQGSCFLLKGIGLVTSFHVTEDSYAYRAHTCKQRPEESNIVISDEFFHTVSDKAIDYAIYNPPTIRSKYHFKISNKNNIDIGDEVIVIGYPNWLLGCTPYIETCIVTAIPQYMGAKLYTISGRIMHGASGGIVLDIDHRVLGIVKGGVETMDETEVHPQQGFISIFEVLEHSKLPYARGEISNPE